MFERVLMLFNLFKLLFHMVFLLGLSLCFALFFLWGFSCVRLCKIPDNDWDMLEIKQFNRKHCLTTFQTQSYFFIPVTFTKLLQSPTIFMDST